jgi:hypothetical protein
MSVAYKMLHFSTTERFLRQPDEFFFTTVEKKIWFRYWFTESDTKIPGKLSLLAFALLILGFLDVLEHKLIHWWDKHVCDEVTSLVEDVTSLEEDVQLLTRVSIPGETDQFHTVWERTVFQSICFSRSRHSYTDHEEVSSKNLICVSSGTLTNSQRVYK